MPAYRIQFVKTVGEQPKDFGWIGVTADTPLEGSRKALRRMEPASALALMKGGEFFAYVSGPNQEVHPRNKLPAKVTVLRMKYEPPTP